MDSPEERDIRALEAQVKGLQTILAVVLTEMTREGDQERIMRLEKDLRGLAKRSATRWNVEPMPILMSRRG